MSLFDQLGGAPALEAAVEDFYARIRLDPHLAGWFEHVDMEALKAHQRAFLAVGLGGPEEYTGRSMRTAHAGLAINDDAFTRTVTHLSDTLAALGVEEPLLSRVVKRVEMMRAAIVTPD